MQIDPNKYSLVIPTIKRLWEQSKDKEDWEKTIVEIAVNTGVHLIAVCMILFKHYQDPRIPVMQQRLVDFYKPDSIIELE